MRIMVVGAGSVGMLLAGRLASAGHDITLVCRTGEQAVALNRDGLTIAEKDGSTVRQVHLTAIGPQADETKLLSGETPQWLFVTVKQKDITDALLQSLKLYGRGTANVLCFQNGMGHVEKLSQVFSPAALYAAITTEAARKRSVTEVIHTGSGETRIGRPLQEAEGAVDDPMAEQLKECMRDAGFPCVTSNNINNAIWNKLLINAVINPMTAVLRVPNGRLIGSNDWMCTMRTLLEEGIAVAEANGIEIAADLWEQLVSVCQRTAANHSSMLQDVTAGRETELEWITGSLLRCADKARLSIPSHRLLYRLVKGLERGN